jgi:hypothetical protein
MGHALMRIIIAHLWRAGVDLWRFKESRVEASSQKTRLRLYAHDAIIITTFHVHDASALSSTFIGHVSEKDNISSPSFTK